VWAIDPMGPPKIYPMKDQACALSTNGTRQFNVLVGVGAFCDPAPKNTIQTIIFGIR
jgi:hypothetical protein